MEARELRIGNIVFSTFPKSEHIITGFCIQFLHEGGDPYVFEPIPLTEEWLLKFGAVKRFASEWDYHLSIGAIKIYFRFNVKWYCELEGIYLDSKIQYVHQLQNLYFALTNQELEIK